MTSLPLQVFYDASCRLCATEMQALKAGDSQGRIVLVDCSAATFDDRPLRADGVTRAAMLQSLHVRDADGHWHRGVDAMATVYAALGFHAVAAAWVHPWLRPLTTRLYAWVVRHRHQLSALGLHHLAPTVLHAAARRSEARPRCQDGACGTHLADSRPSAPPPPVRR